MTEPPSSATLALPRAPTFPAFVADVPEVDDSDYIDDDDIIKNSTLYGRGVLPNVSVSPQSNSCSVPVVPLPVSNRTSLLASILLWRNPKKSAVLFCSLLVFFYLTLVRNNSVLSIFGLLITLYQLSIVFLRQVELRFNLDQKFSIRRPPERTALFSQDDVSHWVTLIADEGNQFQDIIRDLIYCDSPRVTVLCICLGTMVYFVGKYISLLTFLCVLTLLSFSVPLAYEKNKKVVDDNVARTLCSITRRTESCWQSAKGKTAQVLDKTPKSVRQAAGRAGVYSKLKQG